MALWKKSESPPVAQSHAEAPSSVSCRDGCSTRDPVERNVSCRDGSSAGHKGLHYGCGAVYCSIRIRHVWSLLVHTTYGVWDRRRASSVCLSSASSALRLTGATVAPPSHHRDSLLRGVAPPAQDGIPRASLRLRAPTEQSCSFPPSTTCPMLLWVCASVPSPAALRVYMGTVQFAYEFSEVKERETVFWDFGFAPPVFFPGVFKRLRSRYGQIELHLNLFKAQQRNRRVQDLRTRVETDWIATHLLVRRFLRGF